MMYANQSVAAYIWRQSGVIDRFGFVDGKFSIENSSTFISWECLDCDYHIDGVAARTVSRIVTRFIFSVVQRKPSANIVYRLY